MAASELLDRKQVSELLDQPKSALGCYMPYLTDFPAHVAKQGKNLLYDRDEVLRWAAGKDVKAIFAAANKARRNKRKAPEAAARVGGFDNSLCTQLAAGAFLPPAQRNTLVFKKLVARTTQPKTTRIRLVHDWMLEDGPRATHRRVS